MMKINRAIVFGVTVLLASLILPLQPVPVSASGGFSRMSFPGCDILLDRGPVDVSAGTIHVVVKQNTTVLEDRSQPIDAGQLQSYVIHFVDFAKPTGTDLRVHVDVNGTTIAEFPGTYPKACLAPDLSEIPSWLLDGRIAPAIGDRLAIWCNNSQHNVDVWGIDNSSKGFRLATFTVKELTTAGPDGVTKTPPGLGAISASMDDQGNMWIAWNGGPFGANGRDGFGKGLNCHFSS